MKPLKPNEIEILQRCPDDIQSAIDEYQLDVVLDESSQGTKVVYGCGEKKLFNDYKAVINHGNITSTIRNGMINKQLSLEIYLHSCSVSLSYNHPISGVMQNLPG